jgi:arylsulfatase A-like enzyme
MVGALVLAAFEVSALIAAGGGIRSMVACLAAAFVLASLGSFAALSIALAARGALLGLARAGIDWSSALCALVLSSFSVLAAQALVLAVLSGQGIRTAVVSLSAALGVAAGVAFAAAARALARRFALTTSLRVRTACVIAAALATLVLVVALAPGLWQELDIPGLSSLGAPVVFGLVFVLGGIESKMAVRGAMLAWALLAMFCVGHVAARTPGRVMHLIARETNAARFVLGTLVPQPERRLAPFAAGSGSCHPDVEPTATASSSGKADANAPDILFITIDALRWDHTTLAGYERDTTPGLARWAASAAVFSSAMTPASSTRQTFRALFSGVYPSQVLPSTGSSWWVVSFADAQRTLAHHMQDAGYLTVSVTERGKGFAPEGNALAGFERHIRVRSGKGTSGEQRETRARAQIDSILEQTRAQRDKPLFAWTHLMTPHQPYSVSTPSPYGDRDVDDYDWAIRFVDGELARLLQALETDGRLGRTFVIVSADHGQAFREHGNRLHGHTIYQEETNVPLLIWGPLVRAGARAAPISTLDLFPTILDLAGARASRAACGTSLVPVLEDPARAPAREVYMEQVPDSRPYFQVGYVRGHHKLVVTPPTDRYELYDLRADPREQHDLSDLQPRLTDELVRALIAFQEERGMNPASYGLVP